MEFDEEVEHRRFVNRFAKIEELSKRDAEVRSKLHELGDDHETEAYHPLLVELIQINVELLKLQRVVP